ncbi:MAG: hypothetical protein M1429_01655 [Patescibacteria group bacterium]|nr:hypothetical protein [Patescibacteria group bacterium]
MKKINVYLIFGAVAFIGLIIFVLFSFGVIKITPSAKTVFSRINVGEKIFFPQLSQDGSSLYYFGNQGVKLKKFNISTKKTEILYPDDILYTYDVIWSPDKNKLILKNSQPYTNTSTQLLDLKTKKITDLDKNIQSVIWSNNSQNIYYQFQDQEKNLNYLASAKFDGSSEQKIIDLDLPDYSFTWLDNFQKLGFWRPPTDVSGVKLKYLDIQMKTVSDIFNDDRLNKVISSPNGQYFVYGRFYQNDNIFRLSYAKFDGTNNKDLNYQTSVEKTAWSPDNSFFVLAVKEKETENDKFYKIDIKNGKVTNLSYSNEKNQDMIAAENLMLSSDNKTLYFTSNDLLYSLQLP